MTMRDEQFEGMLDAGLRVLDEELSNALAAAPAHLDLVERIEAECEMGMALRVEAPTDLRERVFSATADALPVRRAVIGRIGPWVGWIGWAAAAAVVVLAALQFEPSVPKRGGALDLAELDRAIERFHTDAQFAGAALAELDAATVALAVEIDAYSLGSDTAWWGEGVGLSIDELDEKLWMMEADDENF